MSNTYRRPAPRGYLTDEADAPTLTIHEAATIAGVDEKTIAVIHGWSSGPPALTTLADGRRGWQGRRDIASVRQWAEAIRHAHNQATSSTHSGG